MYTDIWEKWLSCRSDLIYKNRKVRGRARIITGVGGGEISDLCQPNLGTPSYVSPDLATPSKYEEVNILLFSSYIYFVHYLKHFTYFLGHWINTICLWILARNGHCMVDNVQNLGLLPPPKKKSTPTPLMISEWSLREKSVLWKVRFDETWSCGLKCPNLLMNLLTGSWIAVDLV